MTKMSYAEKLQELRRAKGLSQEELAERLGVTRQSVSKWEQAQSYPETEKLIELSRLYNVTVDSLLKGTADVAEVNAENNMKKMQIDTSQPPIFDGESGYKPAFDSVISAKTQNINIDQHVSSEIRETAEKKNSGLRVWPVILVVVLIILAVVFLLNFAAPADDNGAKDQANVAAAMENLTLQELRAYYYDFAQEHRFDYVPFFAEGKTPTESPNYLYFAFAVNLENWGEDKGKMSRDYVDDIGRIYFTIGEMSHLPMWKGWDFDGETYTAHPGSIRELPIYRLRDLKISQNEYGRARYEVVLEDCRLESHTIPDFDDYDRFEAGDYSGFYVHQVERFVYEISSQSFGKPQFIAHEMVE